MIVLYDEQNQTTLKTIVKSNGNDYIMSDETNWTMRIVELQYKWISMMLLKAFYSGLAYNICNLLDLWCGLRLVDLTQDIFIVE